MLAVLGSAVAGYIVGMLWFSPILFLNPWMKVVGKKEGAPETAKKEMPRIMVYGFFNTAAVAFALCGIIELIDVSTLVGYLQVALFLCFSFVITTKFNDMLYTPNTPHWSREPQLLFLINAGYYILAFTAMATTFWFLRP